MVVTITASCASFAGYGYAETWDLWNVHAKLPHFADARAITAGSESFAQGDDPLLSNPRDPWQRRLNYPRVWQLAFHVGLDQSHTSVLGLTFIALFFAGVFIAFGEFGGVTAALLYAMIFSPAVALGVERANADLLIFFLLATALATRSRVFSHLLILAAGMLKLYPIAALGAHLRGTTAKTLAPLAGTAGIFLAYLAATRDDVALIAEATPVQVATAYGAKTASLRATANFGASVGELLWILSIAGVLLVFAASFFVRSRTESSAPSGDGANLEAFRLGACIYCGTFLIGSSFDYKLMFVIFTIPQLVSWARSNHAPVQATARVALTAILFSSWYFVIARGLAVLPGGRVLAIAMDEASSWIVFASLAYLLIVFAIPRAAREPAGAAAL